METYIAQSVEDIFASINTTPEGLTAAEAAKRLQEFGPNEIEAHEAHVSFTRFFAYLRDGFSLLLLLAAVLSFVTGTPLVGFVILGIVLMNAYISILQEVRAEKAMQALKSWVPESAKVLRDGRLKKLDVKELVPGDVISLDQGDRIPADGRLIEAYDIWVNNIPLTGEAEPQPRIASPASDLNISYIDAPNLVFMSTRVVRGHGKAVIFATGVNTKFGEIAHLTLEIAEPPSPLEKEIDTMAKWDFALGMLLGIIFFTIAVLFFNFPLYEDILFMIGVMTAIVPEGLQLTVSSALGINMLQMARHKVLVKRLSAVQTLGSVTIICTDKTGTITKGEMTVRQVFAGNQFFDVSGIGYHINGKFTHEGNVVVPGEFLALEKLIDISVLCNHAKIEPPPREKYTKSWTMIGDTLDGALLIAAKKYGFNIQAAKDEKPLVYLIPFDSERKRATSVHQMEGRNIVYVKGAPFNVFPACTRIILENGRVEELTADNFAYIKYVYQRLAQDGLRIIACAYGELESGHFSPDQNVDVELTFAGLIAMYDPPRLEVKNAVRIAKQAGIEVVIITGDSGVTTEAIATEVGIINPGDKRLVYGGDLNKMSNSEIANQVCNGNIIFARVTPEEKLRIVQSLKESGEIVAVTGDGANDAPSLKEANIGVAMGASGTDIAREAADLVLLDDSFASIVKAVESGRVIYDNIRRFIIYVFSHNWAELFPYFIFIFFRTPLPLLVLQLLSIDLFIDVLPSLGISREPAEPGIMNEPPRSVTEHLFDSKVLFRSLFVGLIIGTLAFFGCAVAWTAGGWQWGMASVPSTQAYIKGTTMMFAGIVLGQVGNALTQRTSRVSTFSVKFSRNKWLLWGIAAQLTIFAFLIYSPFLQPIFGTMSLGLQDWGYLLLITATVIVAEELRKLFVRKMRK